MDAYDLTWIAAQLGGLVALGFVMIAFASRQDDRLLIYLVFANIAFSVHFALFSQWTAAGISLWVIARILLARRFKGRWSVMLGVLAVNVVIALVTAREAADLWPLAAGVCGTIGMFMLRGIPMRLFLAAAAVAWLINSLLIGSIGGTIAELFALSTNLITIGRIRRAKHRPQAS